MKTNDLEKEVGLSKHTIRYYEKEGLIYPSRDENGYRNYSNEDIQILRLVKFLRSLEISIDDVKSIVEGKLNFQECLKVNQIYLDKHIEGMKEVKQTIDNYTDRDLPLIPALANIETVTSKGRLGIQKTTNTVSLGRRLTQSWAKRQIIYGLMSSLVLTFGCGKFFVMVISLPMWLWILIGLVVTGIIELVFIAMAFRQTSGAMLDNSMDQSVEFLGEGICYYEFDNPIKNLKYFVAALLGREQQFMHYYRYEDIKEVEVITKLRYMSVVSPIAYEVYITDFRFEFNDGNSFYFLWPMLLDDDGRYIATILEEKVNVIKDKDHALYAMKNGINFNDYMKNKEL